ncbi:hypothetical protein Dimus_001177 [Dionaea muscipula]
MPATDHHRGAHHWASPSRGQPSPIVNPATTALSTASATTPHPFPNPIADHRPGKETTHHLPPASLTIIDHHLIPHHPSPRKKEGNNCLSSTDTKNHHLPNRDSPNLQPLLLHHQAPSSPRTTLPAIAIFTVAKEFTTCPAKIHTASHHRSPPISTKTPRRPLPAALPQASKKTLPAFANHLLSTDADH